MLKAIRNAFAHASEHIDFETQEIATACKELHISSENAGWGTDLDKSDFAKQLFLDAAKSMTLSFYIAMRMPHEHITDEGYLRT